MLLSGGVAIAFAMAACKSVTAYAVGGVNRSHLDNGEYINGVHHMQAELSWLERLQRREALTLKCSAR